MGLKKLDRKITGEERIGIITGTGKRYYITVADLLSDCVDLEVQNKINRRFSAMVKALQSRLELVINPKKVPVKPIENKEA